MGVSIKRFPMFGTIYEIPIAVKIVGNVERRQRARVTVSNDFNTVSVFNINSGWTYFTDHKLMSNILDL